MQNEFSVATRDRFRSLPLTAVVCLLLLIAQSAALVHSHDGDPQQRYDCNICLKIDSSSDIIAASHAEIPIAPADNEWRHATAELPFLPLLDLRSRAPPQV